MVQIHLSLCRSLLTHHEHLTDGRCRERMVEDSEKEEWVRTLTERPLDREDQPWDVQAVGETRFTLLVLAVAADTDLSPGDRVAVESEEIIDVQRRLTYHTLTQVAQDRLEYWWRRTQIGTGGNLRLDHERPTRKSPVTQTAIAGVGRRRKRWRDRRMSRPRESWRL